MVVVLGCYAELLPRVDLAEHGRVFGASDLRVVQMLLFEVDPPKYAWELKGMARLHTVVRWLY